MVGKKGDAGHLTKIDAFCFNRPHALGMSGSY
jgi:hypothetical protein